MKEWEKLNALFPILLFSFMILLLRIPFHIHKYLFLVFLYIKLLIASTHFCSLYNFNNYNHLIAEKLCNYMVDWDVVFAAYQCYNSIVSVLGKPGSYYLLLHSRKIFFFLSSRALYGTWQIPRARCPPPQGHVIRQLIHPKSNGMGVFGLRRRKRGMCALIYFSLFFSYLILPFSWLGFRGQGNRPEVFQQVLLFWRRYHESTCHVALNGRLAPRDSRQQGQCDSRELWYLLWLHSSHWYLLLTTSTFILVFVSVLNLSLSFKFPLVTLSF